MGEFVRFAFAITALVIAGVLLLLGIGQRTFLAGPNEVVYQVPVSEPSEYAVLTPESLEGVPGQANAVVVGEEGFVAVGSRIDVDAWVEPFAHSVIAAEPTQRHFVEESTVPAGSPEFTAEMTEEEIAEIDPRGSDLWVSEQVGNGRIPLDLGRDQVALVGGEGALSIAWVQDRRTPWAGPLLVAGGFFALLGGVLYLLAVDHNRRGLGPRRGRRGPLQGIRSSFRSRARAEQTSGTNHGAGGSDEHSESSQNSTPKGPKRKNSAKRIAIPTLGLALALGLSGCSASYWPSTEPAPTEEAPSEEAEPNVAPVPVTRPQIDRIVADIAGAAAAGDEDLDAEALEPRFAGDALKQRVANYKIRKDVPKYEVVLPRITDEQLGYELVQSTEGWPRTVFVTLASEAPEPADSEKKSDEEAEEAEEPAASPSLALVLTQANPAENYLVSRIFSLRGGITMPEAAPSDEGTALLAPDLQSLVLPPGEVGEVYAKILAGDTDHEQAVFFDLENDSVIEKSGAAWVKAAKSAAKEDGNDVKYSVSAEQSESPVLSLSTGVGGALVATTVVESRVEAQTGDYQPKAVGAVSALSGLEGPQKRIVSTVAHQLLFFVPKADSGETVQLLGYTTELVGAKK